MELVERVHALSFDFNDPVALKIIVQRMNTSASVGR